MRRKWSYTVAWTYIDSYKWTHHAGPRIMRLGGVHESWWVGLFGRFSACIGGG